MPFRVRANWFVPTLTGVRIPLSQSRQLVSITEPGIPVLKSVLRLTDEFRQAPDPIVLADKDLPLQHGKET